MAYTTINKSTDYFNTKLFTGNGGTQSVTGVDFQPDWVWLKSRSVADSHILFDAVRGVTKRLMSNANSTQSTQAQEVQSFDSDGFTVGNSDNANRSGATMVAWNWKAGTGQGSSNTDGSINTTYTSANTTAGFSISQYTGTGSNATVGHGLSSTPSMIIVKNLSSAYEWGVYHKSLGATQNIYLDSTGAAGSATFWNNTEPTSSVFNVGTTAYTNGSGSTYIAYCFAEKTGYSKFGSYVGNGNADGTFVYTGFKPAFIMYKKSSGTGRWTMEDNKRDPFNVATHGLAANGSSAENTGSNYWDVDLLSNGFKFRTTEQETNQSGQTFIYMAFGAAPLVGSNGVTAKAR